MVVPDKNVAPKSLPVRSCMVRMAKSMFMAFMLPSGLPRPETLAWRVLNIRFLKLWHKSKISDLSHYQNFYEFPKFRIKLLILILLHFNIVRIIY